MASFVKDFAKLDKLAKGLGEITSALNLGDSGKKQDGASHPESSNHQSSGNSHSSGAYSGQAPTASYPGGPEQPSGHGDYQPYRPSEANSPHHPPHSAEPPHPPHGNQLNPQYPAGNQFPPGGQPSPGGNHPLPPGWLQQWDRNHNRWYYVDSATGQSQWNFPNTPPVSSPGPTGYGGHQAPSPAPSHPSPYHPSPHHPTGYGGGPHDQRPGASGEFYASGTVHPPAGAGHDGSDPQQGHHSSRPEQHALQPGTGSSASGGNIGAMVGTVVGALSDLGLGGKKKEGKGKKEKKEKKEKKYKTGKKEDKTGEKKVKKDKDKKDTKDKEKDKKGKKSKGSEGDKHKHEHDEHGHREHHDEEREEEESEESEESEDEESEDEGSE